MHHDTDLLVMRPITPDELPMLGRMVEGVFLSDPHEDEFEMEAAIYEPERSLAVFDGGEPVASAVAFTRHMTVPGGPIPVAAVSWVAVAQTHRRRGLLTRMMGHQLAELHEQQREPVAALWTSEAPIYGRYGYGQASRQCQLTIETAEVRLRPDVDRGSGRLRLCSREDALPALKAVYETVRPQRVGHLDRRGSWWDHNLFDPRHWRENATALRFLVHEDGAGQPDGYAVFNVKSNWGGPGPRGETQVRSLATTTPDAYAAVWGFLLEMDLVRQVRWRRGAIDEPLLYLVDNPRAVQQTLSDSLWLRIVDVDRALAARRYSSPVDTVLDINDEFCPWNTGRYRLTGDADSATCARTQDSPDLSLSSTSLGAAYLGGVSLVTLAAAGLVTERCGGSLTAASAALATDRPPSCPEVF